MDYEDFKYFAYIIYPNAEAYEVIDSGACGDNVEWELDSAGTLIVSGSGDMEDYSPAETPWYSDSDNIKTAFIEDGITSIGNYAFYKCTDLSSLSISDDISSINRYAFAGCTNLTDIDIPDKIISMGADIFYNTGYYNNTDNWEDGALYLGKHLIGVENISGTFSVKSGTLTICGGVIYNYNDMTLLEIPSSVGYIDPYAILSCGNLNIEVEQDNKYYSDIDGVLFNKAQTELVCFAKDSIETEYTIPDGVTKIGDYAFFKCTSLTYLEIPDGVESIGRCAVWWCSSLKSVSMPNTVTFIDIEAFNYSPIEDVFYSGTKEEWDNIDIDLANQYLTSATIHYNATGTASPQITNVSVSSDSTVELELEDVEYDSTLITLFTKDGVLTDSQTNTISAGDTSKTVNVANGADSVKVFIWNSLEGMKPLCEAMIADIE